MVSTSQPSWGEAVSQHYRQSATIKEILVLPDPRDGRPVALVVPDLEHFRRTGETDLYFEVGWAIEYFAQQLPPEQRIRHFILTNQELPKNRRGEIKVDEAGSRYRALAHRGARERQAAPDEQLSPLGQGVISLLQHHAAAAITRDDHLEFDLGLDSLARVELLAALEEAFGLQIADDDLLGIFTVGELIRFVESKHPRELKALTAMARTWKEILPLPPPAELQEQIDAEAGFTGRLLNLGAALWLKLLFKVGFGLRVFGRERLGPGSYILCPNHGSFMDGFLLFAAVPQAVRRRLYFLGYNNYFEGPTLRTVARYMHVLPVNSARYLVPAMQAAAQVLSRGGALGIFPEGARTLTGELRPFKKGVATLAQEVGVPLVPVYIRGSYRAWGPNARFPRPYPLQIIFGRQFAADELAATGLQRQAGLRPYDAIILGLRQEMFNLRDELHRRMSTAGGQY